MADVELTVENNESLAQQFALSVTIQTNESIAQFIGENNLLTDGFRDFLCECKCCTKGIDFGQDGHRKV